MNPEKTAAPSFPDAESVGDHLVVDRVEWVPGADPEPHRRDDGQRAYAESYFRCLRCGVECLSKRDFPDSCDPDPAPRREQEQEAES